MAAHHSAQGLASLGRNGDSMLVHMSPHEVAGLNYLAKKQGTKLTINPQTGLPEAFSLGGFFRSILPTLVGAGFGFTGAPLWAGIAAGAATGAATSKNPLLGAAMGGLGGYGGMGIGSALSNTMAITNPAAAASSAGQTAISSAAPGAIGTTGEIGGANLVGSGVAGGTAGSNAALSNITQAMNTSGVNVADPMAQDAARQVAQNVSRSNFSGINMDPTSSFLKPTVFDKAYGASIAQPSGTMGGSTLVGEARNLANSAASAQSPLIAGAMSSSPTPGFGETFIDQLGGSSAAMKKLGLPLGAGVLGGLEPTDIYGKPIGRSDKEKYDPYATLNLAGDTGLRLYAAGGDVNNNQSSIASGGLQSLYGTSDNSGGPQALSRDGYGVGRLEGLTSAGSQAKAADMFYAQGGPVSFADGGATEGVVLDQISMAPDSATPSPGGIASLANSAQLNQQSQAPSDANLSAPPIATDGSLINQIASSLQADPNYQPKNPIEAAIVKQLKGTDPAQQDQQGLGSLAPAQPSFPTAATYAPAQAMGPTDFSQINTPYMAKGGYLNGQGDGMSDSIPATIEGKQPARLADGEFVIPADVVSHIGNGSSKAGSKRLYAMLDKVRKARTGHTKQGREINPNKYLPA